MGDIKKKRRLFSRPKKIFDRGRIDEENLLVKKYGLKNKSEIWKAKSFISKLRRRAKNLIGKNAAEQQSFFDKLNKIGMQITNISGVLALTESDLFERRLQTFVFKKGFANTPRGARQLITHKKILVNGNVVNIPSFLVSKNIEKSISLRKGKVKEKIIKEEKPEDENLEEEGK